MSDTLRELAKPFPERFVHGNPSGGGTYVKHHVVEQRLLMVLGYPPSFELVHIERGFVPGYTSKKGDVYEPLQNVVVGVIARMTVEIDGREVTVEEAGDCEQPHNWNTDGARLKDAFSDAYKRAAMRLGCGLHLWSQNEFFLYEQLSEAESGESEQPSVSEPQTAAPPETSSPTGAVVSPHSWQDDPWPVLAEARKQGRVDVATLVREAGGVAKRNQTMKLTVSPKAIESWPVEALGQLIYALGIVPSGQGELVS